MWGGSESRSGGGRTGTMPPSGGRNPLATGGFILLFVPPQLYYLYYVKQNQYLFSLLCLVNFSLSKSVFTPCSFVVNLMNTLKI